MWPLIRRIFHKILRCTVGPLIDSALGPILEKIYLNWLAPDGIVRTQLQAIVLTERKFLPILSLILIIQISVLSDHASKHIVVGAWTGASELHSSLQSDADAML